jgi:hypothetical protein
MVYPVCDPATGQWRYLHVDFDLVRRAFEWTRANCESTTPTKMTYKSVYLNNFSKMSIKDMYRLCHPETIRLLQDLWKTEEGATKVLRRDPAGVSYYPLPGTQHALCNEWQICIMTLSRFHSLTLLCRNNSIPERHLPAACVHDQSDSRKGLVHVHILCGRSPEALR